MLSLIVYGFLSSKADPGPRRSGMSHGWPGLDPGPAMWDLWWTK
jgi:hypothetical protein